MSISVYPAAKRGESQYEETIRLLLARGKRLYGNRYTITDAQDDYLSDPVARRKEALREKEHQSSCAK